MEQNIMANEEVVETVAEEIATANSKVSVGKIALACAVIGGVAFGATKLVKHIKAKIKAKKESKVEATDEEWVDELEAICNEKSEDDLDE